MKPVDIGRKLIIANLVALLVSAIIWQILLDCIIGQVDGSIVVNQGILAGGGANVAVFVPVAFDVSVYTGYHHIVAEIEFAFVIEQGSLDVGLDYVGAVASVVVLLSVFQRLFDVL